MKRKVLALLLSVSTMFAFSGCSEASKVSHNLSLEADNFNGTDSNTAKIFFFISTSVIYPIAMLSVQL